MRLALTLAHLGFTTLGIHVFPELLTAQPDGGQAGAYLRIGASVRALGMGNAFVAAANDASAGYWNPAGLNQITAPQLMVMYSVLALDRQYRFVAAAYPVGAGGALSAGWVSFRVGKIEARDRHRALLGEFADDQNAFLFSYGRAVHSTLAFGGTLKLLHHDFADHSAAGFGYDLGVACRPREYLALGASWQNLHAKMYWDNPAMTVETFPCLQRLGIQIRPLSFVQFSIDHETAGTRQSKWHVGGEFYYHDRIALRTGFDAGILTLGVSLLSQVSRQAVALDYGLAPDRISPGWAHQFACLLKFMPSLRAAAAGEFNPPQSVPRQKTRWFVEVIQVRTPYIIITSSALAGLRSGTMLQVYQAQPGEETGRYYGTGEALDLSSGCAIIKMHGEKPAPALGEKLLLEGRTAASKP